jgi:hypothetical protein
MAHGESGGRLSLSAFWLSSMGIAVPFSRLISSTLVSLVPIGQAGLPRFLPIGAPTVLAFIHPIHSNIDRITTIGVNVTHCMSREKDTSDDKELSRMRYWNNCNIIRETQIDGFSAYVGRYVRVSSESDRQIKDPQRMQCWRQASTDGNCFKITPVTIQ